MSLTSLSAQNLLSYFIILKSRDLSKKSRAHSSIARNTFRKQKNKKTNNNFNFHLITLQMLLLKCFLRQLLRSMCQVCPSIWLTLLFLKLLVVGKLNRRLKKQSLSHTRINLHNNSFQYHNHNNNLQEYKIAWVRALWK